jgi:hypothetical protein
MFCLRDLAKRFLYCGIRYIPELLLDGFRCLRVAVRSRAAVNAEILFLRKQLAFYREHQIKPTQLTQAARLSLVFWSQWFDWKEALVIVKPDSHPLAPQRFPFVLAAEVANGKTTAAGEHAPTDRGDGETEPDLGTGAGSL